MVGVSIDPFHLRVAEPVYDPRRQRSDRGDEPCATAGVRARTEWREKVGTRHCGRRRRFRRKPDAGRAEDGSKARSRRKFSGLQSLENSQNGEGISILREAVPWAGGTPGAKEEGATRGWRASRARRSRLGSRVGGDPEPIVDFLNRGAPVAGIAAREADGKTESPGNGAATT